MEIADQVSNEKLFLKIQHESLQVGTGSHELHELHEFFKNSFFKVEISWQEALAGDSCGSGRLNTKKKDSPRKERLTTNFHKLDELHEFLDDSFMEITDQARNNKLALRIHH